MNDIVISAVPGQMVELIWDKIRHAIMLPIEKSNGEATEQSVKEKLLKGEALLIVISRGDEVLAVNTLEILEFESGLKAMYIPLTGGTSLDEWMPRFLEVAKQIARDYGCTQLRGIAVRKGWLRKLADYGWEEIHTTIKCEV